MKDPQLKKRLITITYAAFLLFVVVEFKLVRGIVSNTMHILSPFFLGVVLAFMLNKPMEFFRKLFGKKIKNDGTAKGLAITLAYIMFALIIFLIIWFIVPTLVTNINMFVSKTGIYIAKMEDWLTQLPDDLKLKNMNLQNIFMQLSDIIQSMSTYIVNYLGDIVPRLISMTTNLVNVAFNLVITIVFSINLLAGKEKIIHQLSMLNEAYFNEKLSKKNVKIAVQVNDIFGKYLVGQVTEACILGGLCFIGMKIFRFDYAILISTLIAVTALIPVAGAWIGGGLSFLLLALVSPINAVMFFIYLTILQQLENNLIYPRVVGSSIGLPGIWVIFAVAVGGGLFGLPGIMFSVPTMSVIYALVGENVKNGIQKKRNQAVD